MAIGANQRSFNPSVLLSATNFDGASTADTAGADADSLGVADADSLGVADAEIDGAGAAASSPFEPDFDQTIAARMTIPATTRTTTRLEVPCLGLAVGFGAEFEAGATGVAATGVAKTLTLGVTERTDAFLTTRFTAAFLATFFFGAAFLATAFLVALFLTTRFAAAFFATLFFATFLTVRLAGAFLATFLAGLFFFTATITPWIAVRTQITRVDRTRLPQPPEHFYYMWRNCSE